MKTHKLSTRALACLLTLVMVLAMVPAMAFAAPAEGAKTGTATVNMLKDQEKVEASMCNGMFAEKVDLKVENGEATITMYVAHPVPSFPDQGPNGSVENVRVEYNGKTYTATSDISNKPMKPARKQTVKMFGLTEGQQYPMQVLTLVLPEEAITEGALFKTTAFVAVFMNLDVNFKMQLTDVKWNEPAPAPMQDGNYYVDAYLWSASSDQASMGDKAFVDNRQVLVTVKDGKVTTVQAATGLVNLPPFIGGLTAIKVDGKDPDHQKLEKFTDGNGKEREYVRFFDFQLPESAQPTKMVSYVPLQIIVAGTPMPETFIDAKLKLDWATATPTTDTSLEKPVEPEVPETFEHRFVDATTGIKLEAKEYAVNENLTFEVEVLPEEEVEAREQFAKLLADVTEKFDVYAMWLMNDHGGFVDPEGGVTVSFPIPEGYDASKVALYRISMDENDVMSKTKVNGTLADGFYTVNQKAVSGYAYALVELKESEVTPPETQPETTAPETQPEATKPATPETTKPTTPAKPSTDNPKTGDNMHLIAVTSLMVFSCAAVAVLTLGKKRQGAK